MVLLPSCSVACRAFQLQCRDDLEAVRISATQAYTKYVKKPKTNQHRESLAVELKNEKTPQAIAYDVTSSDALPNAYEVS
jgi:hypothetical protein